LLLLLLHLSNSTVSPSRCCAWSHICSYNIMHFSAPFQHITHNYYLHLQGTRVLHFLGTSLFIAQAAAAAHAKNPKLLLSGIISAYGCAWLGHFFVEKNKPATFKYPLMSLIR
jgi:hypothetical protein